MTRAVSPEIRGRLLAIVAGLWAVLDAVIHIRADQVELLRITGNVITVLAAITVLAMSSNRIRAWVCVVAAIAVLILNLVWAGGAGELPIPAVMLFGGATVLLLLAAWNFRLAHRRAAASAG